MSLLIEAKREFQIQTALKPKTRETEPKPRERICLRKSSLYPEGMSMTQRHY